MIIHREGFKTIALAALLFGIINMVSFFLFRGTPFISWIVLGITVGLLLFIISFFRVPKRKLTIQENAIVCPADGKVVTIEEVTDEEYFHEKRLQISIFMSPANVHVNRVPMDGEVLYSQYHKGKYLVAWHPKSSTENERHTVVISRGNTAIGVKQIAGALARRIVNYMSVGQSVSQCNELGFIKFGSRVDLLLPLGVKVNVKMGEIVQGGVTVIATL
jgi:phosphatidylserine decarboxylase